MHTLDLPKDLFGARNSIKSRMFHQKVTRPALDTCTVGMVQSNSIEPR